MDDTKEFLKQLEVEHKARDEQAQGNNTPSGFRGAKHNRLTEGWNARDLSPSSLHRMDAPTLRNRARDLYNNDALAKSSVDGFLRNVIECGITPKSLVENNDTRKLYHLEFERWAKSEADITGMQHYYDLQWLWFQEVLVGGGVITHRRFLPLRKGPNGRQNPATIELIPEERFAEDKDTYLQWRRDRKSGNPIVRGVEFDAATGRVIGFWVRPFDPTASTSAGSEWDPVMISAENARYSFIRQRTGQYRGYTMLHAAITLLWKLGYYTDNELMASAIKSCFAAMIQTDDPNFEPLLDDPDAGTTDANGNPLERITPGMVVRLKPNESVNGVGPNSPGSDSEPWIMMIMRLISVAMGQSYEEVVRDFSKGSFSSVRSAANCDRKMYRKLQKFAIYEFCDPNWNHFFNGAVFAGRDGFPTRAAYRSSFEEYVIARHRPPGWATVNPLDDARADDIRLRNRTKTRDDILSAEGKDWEETVEQTDREETKFEELGVDLLLTAPEETAAEPGAGQTESNSVQAT